MSSKAVFFDRDNTLIEDPGYLRDPDGVRLMPGAAEAVARLRQAGYRIVIVTNQSGVARGLLDVPTLDAIHARVRRLFAEQGAAIDAIYYCPYLDGPEAAVEQYRRDSDLRKPRPGMFLLAAKEHDIDLSASWAIGDSPRDTEAGRAAGCRTIQLVRGDAGTNGASPDYCFHTLLEATECILSKPGRDNAVPALAAAQAAHSSHGVIAASDAAPRMSSPDAKIPIVSCAAASTPGPVPVEVTAADRTAADSRASASRTPDRSERLLEEIVQHARAWQRQRSMEDFTLAKLAGAGAQIAAIGVAVWAILAMAEPRADVYPSHRWLAAIFLQLVALTCFVLHRQR